MTNSRDDHQEATGLAGLQIRELANHLAAAKQFAENEVQPIVMNAVGAAPGSEAGQNAAGMIAYVVEKLEELAGVCENAIAEMTRYGGGF